MRSAPAHPDCRTSSGISLRELFPRAKFFGGTPQTINACCDNSQHCKSGDLFAAILGPEHDGHDFADEAVRNGAVAVLAERILPIGVPTCIVDDSRVAFGELCHALAGQPSEAMSVVGVSGSYGKTTTSLLIASILESAGCPIGILGSFGYCDGRKILTEVDTTPNSPELVRWLSAAANNGCTHAVVEASSHGLATKRLAGTQLDAAVMTNVRRAHLDKHGSVLAYRRIKRQLFEHLKPDGFAVMNADDPASRHLINSLDHPLITIGMQGDAEIHAELLEVHHGEQTFLLTAGEESIPVCTKIIGRAHVYNCLSAAAVGLVMGLDLVDVVRGLESVETVPGRMERVGHCQPFATYVDAANTSDSLASALKSLRNATDGRLICVYGAGAGTDPDDRALLGRTVERFADLGIITRNNPHNEDPLQIAHDILDGYDRPSQAHLIPDRAKAIGWSLAECKPGDTVLIAGRGDEKQEIVDGKRLDFDDREVVRAFLEAMDEIPSTAKIA